jgi:transcription termination factor Rho
MTDSEFPPRRGRGRPRRGPTPDALSDADPYRESSESEERADAGPTPDFEPGPGPEGDPVNADQSAAPDPAGADPANQTPRENSNGRPWQDRADRGGDRNSRGRRGRRQRGRGRERSPRPERGERGERPDRPDRAEGANEWRDAGGGPPVILVVDGETAGWFDPARDAGFIRRAEYSYLNEPGDAYVSPQLCRQYGLRRGDALVARTGRDQRGRMAVAEIVTVNGSAPDEQLRRPDFQTLTASYPERRLTLETGRPAKAGPELTRRAIDLIAPIGYGQRGLIVAPARAGKTMLMQAITEGIAYNHPEATLLILLVDERPEEVSEAISWGVGEVVASSFDQPAKRHVEVVEMVLERSRRLVELGKDVVIVLDSLTRMARAFNTAERGTGRTLSGGLDTSAMARPKAFFGSARFILPQHGGGSLTIIATALVETGSRMDDVIFEEFKGTGNCEIKLDRSLAEKRIFPAFDIATSGTRREEKLYKAEQIDAIYTLRRGLQQMPPQAAMEWLIKRIAGTTSNDALLAGL